MQLGWSRPKFSGPSPVLDHGNIGTSSFVHMLFDTPHVSRAACATLTAEPVRGWSITCTPLFSKTASLVLIN